MPKNNQLPNYINGHWQTSVATETRAVFDPATAEVLAQAPLSTSAEVDAAAGAFEAWRHTPATERIQPLFKLKDLMETHLVVFSLNS